MWQASPITCYLICLACLVFWRQHELYFAGSMSYVSDFVCPVSMRDPLASLAIARFVRPRASCFMWFKDTILHVLHRHPPSKWHSRWSIHQIFHYLNHFMIRYVIHEFVALGPLLASSLGPNTSPSLEPLVGPSLPSEATHARSKATRSVTANCAWQTEACVYYRLTECTCHRLNPKDNTDYVRHITQTKSRTWQRLNSAHLTKLRPGCGVSLFPVVPD